MNPNDEFKEVIETANDVSLFLSLTNAVSLTEENIKTIFYKSNYIERFIFFLKSNNFNEVFEIKMKEYFLMKKKNVVPSISSIEFLSDEVLSKIITLQLPPHLFRIAVNQYFYYCSFKRFENLINNLAAFQALFVNVTKHLSEILSPSEIETVLMFGFWRKVIDNGEENLDFIRLVLKKMFLDKDGIKLLVEMLCLDTTDEYFTIRKSLVEIIISEFCEKDYFSSWKLILESRNLELILCKTPVFIDAILSIVEVMGNEVKCSLENQNQELVTDLDFGSFIKLLKNLFHFQSLCYKLKRLVYVNKNKEKVEHWEKIENALLQECDSL